MLPFAAHADARALRLRPVVVQVHREEGAVLVVGYREQIEAARPFMEWRQHSLPARTAFAPSRLVPPSARPCSVGGLVPF